MSWPTFKLGEVADVKIGPFGSLLHKHDYLEGGVPLVNPMHIDSGRIVPDQRHAIAPEKASQLANYRMVEDDVILARRGEMGRCAVVRSIEHGFLCGTGSLIVRPGPLLSSKFLSLLLSSPDMVRIMERASLGTTMPNLNQTIVANLPIALPPLDEQRRIAAILDHADALRAEHRQVVSYLGDLSEAVFLDMFGDPDVALASGPILRFGDIADLQGGRNLVADDKEAASEFRVLKISAVTSGQFKAKESKALPTGYQPPEDHVVRQGDLLISRANTAELVGAVAYVEEDPSNLVLPDKIWRFVWLNPDSVPLYYRSLFRTAAVRRRISQLSSGTGGSMKNISKAKLVRLELPKVTIAEQREFARRVSAIPRPTSNEFDELFTSLQSRAFSGRL